MSEFANFTSAALQAFYKGEFLPTLALIDYLADRGDERAVRLRRRFLMTQKRIDSAKAKIEWLKANPDYVLISRGNTGIEILSSLIRAYQAEWVSYFIRLMSVKPGERVPRHTVNAGYAIVSPAS